MLRYQILVCNEEFVFHVHAAAIKLRGCAECAAHSFVIRLRTTVFAACADGARMSRFFGVSSGEMYSTTDTL